MNNSSLTTNTAHYHALYVDDTLYQTHASSTHTANWAIDWLNQSISVKGGRHILTLDIEAGYEIVESVEEDNRWTAPAAIYQPYDLDVDPDHTVNRTAPPDRNPESYSFYSCDVDTSSLFNLVVDSITGVR